MVAEIRTIAGDGDPVAVEAAMRHARAPGHERVTALWDTARNLWWQIATANRRVALAEARKASVKLPIDDRQQEAMIGLYEGVCRWDPDRGPLDAYVGYWVRRAIYIAARASQIRLPQDVAPALGRALHFRRTERAAGRAASFDQMAAAGGISTERLVAALGATAVASIDEPTDRARWGAGNPHPGWRHQDLRDELQQYDGRRVGDLIPAPEAAVNSTILRSAIDRLPGRLREIMASRLAGETHAEIAPRLGISKNRVLQLEGLAIARLRSALSGDEHGPLIDALGGDDGCTVKDVSEALGWMPRAEVRQRLDRARAAGLVVLRRGRWFPTGEASP
jgi:RNA polymerase sigma factor (sigma-70 family)